MAPHITAASRGRRARSSIAVALVGVALTPLAGCAAGSDDTAAESGPLEVWVRSGPEGVETYEDVIAAFTEETGIEVDFQNVLEFDTQLQARAAQKDLPDIMINDAGSLGSYAAQGYLKPIDPESIEGGDQISDASWSETVGTDGTTYAVPYSRQAVVTIIRKDWREKLGFEVPTSWEELSELANAFATQDPDGNGQADTYGMAVPGTAENGYMARWGSPYIWQAGGDLLAEKDGAYTSVVDSPETIEGLEFIKSQFCTPGNVVPGSINLTTAEQQAFDQGIAGIYLTGAYKFSVYDALFGQENVEAIPMPTGPVDDASWAEGENIYFGSTSDLDDAQRAFAAFMVSEDAQIMEMDSPGIGGTEPYASVVQLPVNQNIDVGAVRDDPRWNIVLDAYNNDTIHRYPWNINFLPFRQILADGMNAMMADCGSDIPALLKGIDDGFQTEIANQGIG